MFVKRWQGLPAKCQRRVLITSRISLLNAGRRGQAVSFCSYVSAWDMVGVAEISL